MQRPLTRQLAVALAVTLLAAAGCDSSDEPPTSPSGASRLTISPQPDFLTVGTTLTLTARQAEGTTAPRIVAADWSSSDGRVVSVDRNGQIVALAPGSTTIRAVFESDSATLAIRTAPDFAGTWTGSRRVVSCIHPRPDFCATTHPINRVVATTLLLTQSRDRVSGTLSLSPPLASPSSAVTGIIGTTGGLTLEGTIISTPASGASTTLGTLADFRTDIEPATGIMRGSFVEARTDPDGTAWRVSWEIQGLAKSR